MPKSSEREMLLNDLNHILMILAIEGKEDEPEFKEILDLIVQIERNRYLDQKNFRSIPKSTWIKDNLMNLLDKESSNITRMSKMSFLILLELIKDHEIFKNNSNNKQEDI
jgi:hypothetical protein